MRSTLKFATYFLLPGVVALALVGAGMAQSSNVSIYATGLNNPRGLTFGHDGILYELVRMESSRRWQTICRQAKPTPPRAAW
jgi:hypothetical protein